MPEPEQTRRDLSSFDDAIIVRTRQAESGLFYSTLDCGFITYPSDPDFSSFGTARDEETSISGAATRIRRAAQEEKHPLLGYDLHYRLAPHWERKERLVENGLDPNEVILDAQNAPNDDRWNFDLGYFEWVQVTRHVEFVYLVEEADVADKVKNAGMTRDQAEDQVLDVLSREIAKVGVINKPEDFEDRVLDRLALTLSDIEPEATPGGP